MFAGALQAKILMSHFFLTPRNNSVNLSNLNLSESVKFPTVQSAVLPNSYLITLVSAWIAVIIEHYTTNETKRSFLLLLIQRSDSISFARWYQEPAFSAN